MGKRVTIEMVAKEAGVSRGTVDRVINQRPHVSKDQYDRVMEAIRKLEYEPKRRQAKALGISIPEKKICRLGILLPSRNPYYLEEVRRGIRDAQAQLADYSVEMLTEQCSSSTYPEEVLQRIDTLMERGADGLAVYAMDCEPVAQRIDQLHGEGVPVVTYDVDVACRRLLFYGKDPARCGRVAGNLMSKYVDREKKIIIGIGSREIGEQTARAEGFMEAMQEAGFDAGRFEQIETYGDYTLTYRKLRRLLESGRDYGGIYMAYHNLTGCMDAVREAGGNASPFVVYSDMSERVARYLESGELAFCVAPDVYRMVYWSLIILKEYLLDHRRPSSETFYTDIEIICRENVTGS